MIRQRLILPSLLVAWVSMILACGGGGNGGDSGTGLKPVENPIAYEILDKWDAVNNLFGMAILVDESASKEEILQLAENLKRRFAGKYIQIIVFDSRDTYLRCKKFDEAAMKSFRNNQKEHEATRELDRLSRRLHLNEEENKHWLMTIWSNGEIEWTAPDRKSSEERAKQRQAEAVRKAEEEKTRETRAEARKKVQEEARKEAAQKKVEERATSYLRYAKKLIDRGMEEKAKERLQEIVKDLPDTEAAKEAKQLLGVLNGK